MGRQQAAALERLGRRYREHVTFLRGRMVAMGVPAAAVDDATHDVLEVLVRRIDDYDARYSLRQWMSGVARRVAKRYRERAVLQVVDSAESLEAGASSDPERRASAREDAELLEGFLDALDPDKWAVFVLSEIEGLQGSEIAAELGVNLNTAYARLRAARTTLQRTLARRRARNRRWLVLGAAFDRLAQPWRAARSAMGFVSMKLAAWVALGLLAFVVAGAWLGQSVSNEDEPLDAASTPSMQPELPNLASSATDAEGLVAGGSIRGRIVDPEGAGIANADVCGWRTSTVLRLARKPNCVRADDAGYYRLNGLGAADWLVSAGADGFVPAHASTDGYAPSVRLDAGRRADGIDVVLQRGAAKIVGRVVDATGGPIPGARVLADGGVTPQLIAHRGVFTLADEDGRFSVSTHRGAATLRIEAPGYVPMTTHAAAPTQAVEVALVPAASASGIVVGAESGEPVAGAVVQANALDSGASPVMAVSEADGRFVVDELMPGRYLLSVSAIGRTGQLRPMMLGLGESVSDLRIETKAAASVAARVETEQGDPCRSGHVVLTQRGTGTPYRFPLEPDGTVQLWVLEPGTYDPVVLCGTHIAAEAYPPVVVDREPVEGLRWLVTPGATIRGRVTREDPSDVTVWVRAQGVDGERRAAATPVGPGGDFTLEGLAPGRYLVNAAGLLHPPSDPVELEVEDQQAIDDVMLELRRGATIRGTVRDESGRPAAGVHVETQGHARRHYAPTYSAHDGSFVVEGLQAGSYRVVAAQPGGAEPVLSESVSVEAQGSAVVDLVVPDHDGVIRGTVLDENGGPVPDAFVLARPSRVNGLVNPYHPVITDPDGSFELRGLPEVAHDVVAHRRGGGTVTADGIQPGRDVVLSMPRMGALAGTVRVLDGRTPKWIDVEAVDPGSGQRRHEMVENGVDWALHDVSPGTYTIRVATPQGAASIEGVVLEPGEAIDDLVVELGERIAVTGVVVDLETGQPVEGIAVTVVPRHERASHGDISVMLPGPHHTDAQGRFEVNDVVPGRVWVVGHPRHPRASHYAGFRMPETIAADDDGSLAPIRLPRLPRPVGEMPLVAFDFDPDFDALWGPGVEPRLVLRDVDPTLQHQGASEGDVVLAIDGHDVTGRDAYLVESFLLALPDTRRRLELQGGATVTATAASVVAP